MVLTPSEREKHFRQLRKFKLSKEDILSIRKLAKAGMKQKLIAKAFNVTAGHISRILKGGIWTHV